MNYSSPYHRLKWEVFLLAGLLLPACQQDQSFACLEGMGEELTMNMDWTGSSIKIEGSIDVYISKEDKSPVLRGPENKLNRIHWEEKGDTLVLIDRNYCNWVKGNQKPVLVVSQNQLNYAWARDDCEISGDSLLELKQLQLELLGVGDVHLNFAYFERLEISTFFIANQFLSGDGEFFLARAQDDSQLIAPELKVKHIQVNHHGSNRFLIHPLDRLSGSLTRFGTIELVHLPPRLELDHWGNGKLILPE